jgi:hypothetical protein
MAIEVSGVDSTFTILGGSQQNLNEGYGWPYPLLTSSTFNSFLINAMAALILQPKHGKTDQGSI